MDKEQVMSQRNSRRRFVPGTLDLLERRALLATLTVTNLLDGSTPPVGSLRYELGQAQPGDTVNFASSLSGGTINLQAGGIFLSKAVTVSCTTAQPVTVNGQGNAVFNVLYGGNVALSGINIAHGGTYFAGNNYTSPGLTVNYGGSLTMANTNISTSAIENDGTLFMGGGSFTAGLPSGLFNYGTLTITRNALFQGNAAETVLNYGDGTAQINARFIGNAGDVIVSESPNLLLNHCTFTGNTSTDGEPIVKIYAGGTIQLSTFSNNGGSYAIEDFVAPGTLTLFGVNFTGNTSGAVLAQGYGGPGGNVVVSHSTFSNNTGANNNFFSGGAVIDLEGPGVTASILASTVTNNTIFQSGAILASGGATLSIDGSTIDHNTQIANPNSSAGGAGLTAIIGSTGTLKVNNSTIAYNTGVGTGGGVLVSGSAGGVAQFTNDTIAFNQVNKDSYGFGSGGGIGQFPQGRVTIKLQNTIVAGNTAAVSNPDLTGPGFASSGHNLIGNAGTVTGWLSTDLVGNTAAPINPLLGPLQINGTGTTKTLKPLAGSPAIGKGDPAFVGSADQNNTLRVAPDTIGSVYVPAPMGPVTTPVVAASAVDFALGDLDGTSPFPSTRKKAILIA